jgi:hypothetical protein
MAAIQRSNNVAVESRDRSPDAHWPELVSRAVDDLSRIVHAEIRLAELGIKNLIEQEIDRSLKIAIALAFLLCAAVCAVGAALIGFHALLGRWWAAFAIVAAISGGAGLSFFLLARRRSDAGSTT